MKTSDSQGFGGRAAEGQGGAGGAVGDGMLGVGEVEVTLVAQVGVWEKGSGLVSGGDGGRGLEEQGMVGCGRAGTSWGCVEDGEMVGDGSAGGVALERSINGKPINRRGL